MHGSSYIMLPVILPLLTILTHVSSGPISSCECGIENVSPRMINSAKSPDGMFPWLVYIETETVVHDDNDDDDETFVSSSCTGSIISDRHILTAAHCLHDGQKASDVYVWLFQGCGKKRKTGLNKPLKVSRVFKHPRYNPKDEGAATDDLAIFELKSPLKFNKTFMPVCLSQYGFTTTRSIDNLIASGWGKTNPGFFSFGRLKDSDCLQHADLDLISDRDCRMYWGSNVDISKTICAGGTTNICDGDSGGPLMSRKDGRLYQVGVTSFGREDCGFRTGTPSGFERVSAHIDWIKKVTGKRVCFK